MFNIIRGYLYLIYRVKKSIRDGCLYIGRHYTYISWLYRALGWSEAWGNFFR